VVREGALTVVADASLYYRRDLVAALRDAGETPGGPGAGHYILAAYRAWGERCAERLEGDFAFVLWDGAARRAVAARDFGGKRPLFYAEAGRGLLVASTIGGVAAGCPTPPALDLATVAADAAGLFAADAATCYEGVCRLGAGYTLVYAAGATRVTRHWTPPSAPVAQPAPFDDAAAELRTLLEAAARERLGATATSVWLSGGWDSTAVFASGERVLADRGTGEHLRAVSVSYPPGDPGREDELIAAAAAPWGSPVRWIDVDTVPLLDGPEAAAARRDEPFAHGFESTTRALARASRAVGTRVAFDGNGGDQLFQLSPLYLADLLRAGRWATLAREWRGRRLRGGRTFFRYAVQPLLPPGALALAARLRGGRRLAGHFERELPPWISAAFARRHDLVGRDRAAIPPREGLGAADAEARWLLSYVFFPRVLAAVAEHALEEGVELRSPLFDNRVVAFAAARPREDRARGAETKRLLRAAMRGALPDALLAPRARRTGMPGAYLARSLRATHASEIERLLAAPLALAEAGVLDGAAFRGAWARYQRGDNSVPALHLLLTLHAELWMRAHGAAGTGPD
jgi:asparagine synthase (glutamine-hydrolysing)